VKVKCHFAACQETIEAPDDPGALEAGPTATVLAAGLTFGHAQYQPVPSILRKVSGRPWVCPYHDAMVGATSGLTAHEEQQRQSLVSQIRIGRMTQGEGGWYLQTPPKPVPERIIREDDGSIRANGSMVRWWSQEEMIAALTPETTSTDDYKVGPTAEGRTSVFVKEPAAGFKGPEASDDAE
jgi:hypothetical protein